MGKDQNMQEKAGPQLRTTGAVCEVCGNHQDRCFEVHVGGERHIFDSFECAIRGLMPKCSLCGRLIFGPGIQIDKIRVCSTVCASLYSAQEIYLRRDFEARNQF